MAILEKEACKERISIYPFYARMWMGKEKLLNELLEDKKIRELFTFRLVPEEFDRLPSKEKTRVRDELDHSFLFNEESIDAIDGLMKKTNSSSLFSLVNNDKLTDGTQGRKFIFGRKIPDSASKNSIINNLGKYLSMNRTLVFDENGKHRIKWQKDSKTWESAYKFKGIENIIGSLTAGFEKNSSRSKEYNQLVEGILKLRKSIQETGPLTLKEYKESIRQIYNEFAWVKSRYLRHLQNDKSVSLSDIQNNNIVRRLGDIGVVANEIFKAEKPEDLQSDKMRGHLDEHHVSQALVKREVEKSGKFDKFDYINIYGSLRRFADMEERYNGRRPEEKEFFDIDEKGSLKKGKGNADIMYYQRLADQMNASIKKLTQIKTAYEKKDPRKAKIIDRMIRACRVLQLRAYELKRSRPKLGRMTSLRDQLKTTGAQFDRFTKLDFVKNDPGMQGNFAEKTQKYFSDGKTAMDTFCDQWQKHIENDLMKSAGKDLDINKLSIPDSPVEKLTKEAAAGKKDLTDPDKKLSREEITQKLRTIIAAEIVADEKDALKNSAPPGYTVLGGYEKMINDPATRDKLLNKISETDAFKGIVEKLENPGKRIAFFKDGKIRELVPMFNGNELIARGMLEKDKRNPENIRNKMSDPDFRAQVALKRSGDITKAEDIIKAIRQSEREKIQDQKEFPNWAKKQNKAVNKMLHNPMVLS